MRRSELRNWARTELAPLTELPEPSRVPAETVALEVDLLLTQALGISTVELLSSAEKLVTPEEREKFSALITRRKSSEPIAYLLGRREFFGLDFVVNSSVLIPRPETELLVERVIAAVKTASRPITIIDIGTGSGAIVIAALHELSEQSPEFAKGVRGIGVDVSATALAIARENSSRFGLDDKLDFIEGDLLSDLSPDAIGPAVIVSNPPYIADGELLPKTVDNFEPQIALRAGARGLDIIDKLLDQALAWIDRGCPLLMEIGYGQGPAIVSALNKRGHFRSRFWKDLSGIERVIEIGLNAH